MRIKRTLNLLVGVKRRGANIRSGGAWEAVLAKIQSSAFLKVFFLNKDCKANEIDTKRENGR